MSFWNWQDTLNFYKYYCSDNNDFINKLNELPINGYDANTIVRKDTVINNDIIEATNIDELLELYKIKKLITIRLGCVESSFLIENISEIDTRYHLSCPDGKRGNDKYMKTNAGLYYSNDAKKEKVCKWWITNTEELVKNSILTSCFCFLNFDLVLWSLLGIKNKILYNFDLIPQIILQNSEGQKILFVGNNVDSIRTSYNNGIQNMWNFDISKFEMYFIKTPQTTLGMEYPDKNMIHSTNKIVDEISEKYSDFDTAIFACGAYSAPLINILRKKYDNKNLIYLGSKAFEMFGVYSKGMPLQNRSDMKKENWIEVVETLPEGCQQHPEPKYWK